MEIVKSSDKHRQLGLQALKDGKVAIILLAGGQGTRLGSDIPKGMFKLNDKTLFEMQAEKIKQLPGPPHWYIMTSIFTRSATESYFKEHNNFGLHVTFFNQASILCTTLDNQVIYESETKPARSPNGNGDLYQALKREGLLQQLPEVVFVYSVDNMLCKIADPDFVGCFLAGNYICAAKTTPKLKPEEAAGVVCCLNGRPAVVEYTELSKLEKASGDLNQANLCMHLFSKEFLLKAAECDLKYHKVIKKISSYNTKIDGYKYELFIFDTFHLCPLDKFLVYQVERKTEFWPLKSLQDVPTHLRPSP